MASFWRQFSKLGSVANVYAKACVQHSKLLAVSANRPVLGSSEAHQLLPVSSVVTQSRWASSDSPQTTDYAPPSPYKNPGPRRYGYVPKMFAGGVLPRHGRKPLPIPTYKQPDNWSTKKALFGQNDYIDILGSGNVHPVDLMRGPEWLIGFNGNELQRLVRRIRFQGNRLKAYYPTKYLQIQKRISFLYKKYNHHRISKNR
ncbi:39S ribosomal protein L51, mitochondrial-like [Haliotis rufescens]|uniref:39S ribosomal protein L51, mitochondrial-like n=1 Tax=Haliotis rufescens TaxID=6454 RepID=UPI00201ED49F|nr:39S ribosomal protein L51, mitochondrial-like [Haliotis rufescens]